MPGRRRRRPCLRFARLRNCAPFDSGGWVLGLAQKQRGETAVLLRGSRGGLFAFAELWDRWKDPSGEWVRSCSIRTTTSNAVMSAAHDRMPVMLNGEDYDLWLDLGMKDVRVVSDLFWPFDPRAMLSGEQPGQSGAER